MKDCVVCHHSIDDQAKICVFCNSDPETGQRFDTKPLLDEHFSKKQPLGPAESALEFFRQRQALVVMAVIAVLVLALFGLHRWSILRNEAAAGAVPGIPLTEVADVNGGNDEPEVPMPKLEFQYPGNPRSMRTYTLEPGAVPPPEVVQQPQAATTTPGAAPSPMLPRREQPAPQQQQFQSMQGLPLGMPPLHATPQPPPPARH